MSPYKWFGIRHVLIIGLSKIASITASCSTLTLGGPIVFAGARLPVCFNLQNDSVKTI